MRNQFNNRNIETILGARYESTLNESTILESSSKTKAKKQINDLLKKIIKNKKPCICSQNSYISYEKLSLIDRNNFSICNVICRNCGLIRIEPQPEANFYSQIYGNIYWKLMHGNAELSENRFNFSVKRAKPFLENLKNNCKLKSKKILEIGASYGAGLYGLKDCNCKCLVGYDFDKQFIKVGKVYSGIDLRYGGIEDAVKVGEKYDIVILRHVLEHFLDPLSELVRLKQLVSNNGLLFVEVPGVLNLKNYSYDPLNYFDVFHPYSFSLKTLTFLLNRAGYSLVSGNEHIYSYWKISNKSEIPELDLNLEFDRIVNHLLKLERNRKIIQFINNTLDGKIFHFLLKKYTKIKKLTTNKK